MSRPAEQLFARVQSLDTAARERARLAVVPPGRVRARRVPFIVLISAIALTGVVGLLMFNTSLQQGSFTEATLAERAAATTDREETLRMELDDLRNPQRIAEEAQRMGMIIPAAPVFLTMDGTVLGAEAEARTGEALRITPRPRAVPQELRAPINVVEVPASVARESRRSERSSD